jgi:hypothetical protein
LRVYHNCYAAVVKSPCSSKIAGALILSTGIHCQERTLAKDPMLANPMFAHVLLFACPECQRPLSSACFNTKRSMEDADAHWYNPHCHCGWHGDVRGITAVKHWVEPWPREIVLDETTDGECDDHMEKNVKGVSPAWR